MNKIHYIFILSIFSMAYSMNFITPDNPKIQYFGRFDFSDQQKAVFDWPGVYLQFVFEGTSCSAVLEGKNCFDLFVDGKKTAKVIVGSKKDTVELVSGLEDSTHLLILKKRTESNFTSSVFYGIILDKGKNLKDPPPVPSRKIEFVGDSYTAGFANEYKGRECAVEKTDSVIFSLTNTNLAFGPLTADRFGAQYQINAYSGKGLVRNFNGIDKGKELLYYYDKLLISPMNKSGNSPNVKFSSWKPDVIVIGIGINDFQADPPYADSSVFDSVYTAFLDRMRVCHPGVKFICCATTIWPENTLIPRIKSIVESQKAQGKKDVFYFEFKTENNALYGHPDINDHKKIANELTPLVAKITGWDIR